MVHKKYQLPKKPIEYALDEIKALKKLILELQKELEPIKIELALQKQKEELEEAEYVVENSSWWWN
tara:strand:- start:3158 stop:3355 length:198 start_codon:yes stop_codon:yes gene_type:complete